MSKNNSHNDGRNALNTCFRFTKAELTAVALHVKARQLDQVECCDTEAIGLRAMVYASGKIAYHSRYCLNKRSYHLKLFDFNLGGVEAARSRHNAIRLMAQQGIDPKAPKPVELSFDEFAHEHYLPLGQGKASHKDDVAKFRLRLSPKFGTRPLASITTAELSDFLHSLLTVEKLCAATVNRYRSVLRALFAYAVESGVLERNPATPLRLLRENNQRIRFLSANDMAAFMDAADRDPNRAAALLLMLLALTGARLGEGLTAKHADIDLERGVWHLPTSKSGKPGVIYLSEPAKAIVQELRERNEGGALFPGLRGNDLMSRPIKAFKRICQKARLAGFRIHDLRHGWASTALNAGVPIAIVSANLRHASITMTTRYAHPNVESLQAANDTVAGLLRRVA